MSDYRLALLKLARDESDEEFNKVLHRMDALSSAMLGVLEAFKVFSPYLLVDVPDEALTIQAEGQCVSCAAPCPSYEDGTLDCPVWCEYIEEKCTKCTYFDVATCTIEGGCEQGSYFMLPEAPTVDIFPGEEIEV